MTSLVFAGRTLSQASAAPSFNVATTRFSGMAAGVHREQGVADDDFAVGARPAFPQARPHGPDLKFWRNLPIFKEMYRQGRSSGYPRVGWFLRRTAGVSEGEAFEVQRIPPRWIEPIDMASAVAGPPQFFL